MAKAVKKKAPKKRASIYEKPVKFNGTFEDMIAISATGAGANKKSNSDFNFEMSDGTKVEVLKIDNQERYHFLTMDGAGNPGSFFITPNPDDFTKDKNPLNLNDRQRNIAKHFFTYIKK